MVLQNKYKARASRRYKNKKGISTDKKRQQGDDTKSDQDGESGSGSDSHTDKEPSSADETVYRRRPKMKDNAWRYQEEEVDPHEGTLAVILNKEIESEPEVDFSGFQAKMAALDMNAKPQFDLASDEEQPEPDDGPIPGPMSSDELISMLKQKNAAEEAKSLKARLAGSYAVKPTAAAWRRSKQNAAVARPAARSQDTTANTGPGNDPFDLDALLDATK
ncbi:hypothetical protein MYAM1_000379 [Malassezia yamatoensis]|uniref:Uncharacterized protein n=1 Tax=Malassezia yamatoensis TaxID=253288 RepID=A0AAJ6CFY2_9BASI|nr:hypothetical protein MYAM1_000379 [Malassezia yamatoensis]